MPAPQSLRFYRPASLSHPDIGRDVDVCPAMRAVLLAPPSAREAEDQAAELQAGDVRADAPFAIGLAQGERDLRPHENVAPDPEPNAVRPQSWLRAVPATTVAASSVFSVGWAQTSP